ncbi:MAG: sel1 repeat family protein [Burkholderiales bacterium]|nr:sel1 repeat family protein [Burkholderiales bacterium]
MRRQDIQLLARARAGDAAARCEAGRRYLQGSEGFARHPTLGLEYLSHPSVASLPSASIIVAESLALHEIVRLEQLRALRAAAVAGSAVACIKLGVWTALTSRNSGDATRWLELAAQAGHAAAPAAVRALARSPRPPDAEVFGVLGGEHGIEGDEVIPLALTRALVARDDELIPRLLNCALRITPGVREALADIVCSALVYAEGLRQFDLEAPSARIEALLEDCVRRGSATAALLLGRALCGLDAGALKSQSLVSGQNMRKGVALLLRAADAGKDEAWMLLYSAHSDNHASVANPQMARFFLEKAALAGALIAQRRLGALILRSAHSLHESEQGIHWLHQAAQRGDDHAMRLLRSLVLPVAGPEGEAAGLIAEIRRDDPWMACRLRTARDFGLTKLEGLSVDVATAVRPWGLVVGPNPFITQAKLSTPRAIPALTAEAAQSLRRSAAFFEQARPDAAPMEGDLRKRSVRLRHLLARHGAEESLFFAEARSTTLETLRQGTKWAFHVRQPLRMALAA